MIVAVLAEDDIINQRLYTAGQVATVPDDYTNVRRVVRRLADVQADNERQVIGVGVGKILAMVPDGYELVPNAEQRLRKNAQLVRNILSGRVPINSIVRPTRKNGPAKQDANRS